MHLFRWLIATAGNKRVSRRERGGWDCSNVSLDDEVRLNFKKKNFKKKRDWGAVSTIDIHH